MTTIDIDSLIVGQLKQIQALVGGGREKVAAEPSRPVVVRSGQSGVWMGTLVRRVRDAVHLTNARKIWQWSGANTTSDIATLGVSKGSKVGPPVTTIVYGVCEVIDATSAAVAAVEARGWGT